MGNTFGHLFRITTFGESHGVGLGVVVDGCPAKLALAAEDVQRELDRRRPGQSTLVSQRHEDDRVELLSGVVDGLTLGTPIAMLVRNADARGKDYGEMATKYRPSHADYTYDAKFGIRAVAGGGRASARETLGRVAAGAVARKVLAGVELVAWVDEVADIAATVDGDRVTVADVETTPVRCPDPAAAAAMIERIEAARKAGDSLGGVVRAVARGVAAGLGEPVFDKLDADLAKAMLSIPAVKGFEIGSGFAGTRMTGSTHNDLFYFEPSAERSEVGPERGGERSEPSGPPRGEARQLRDGGRIRTRTNYSGGVQGGISNGEAITLRIAFKPTATIMRPQPTVDRDGNETVLEPRGRHDPCVLPRAVPIVEAMLALVLADHALRQRARE
jgi:chorismate synthase